jgi:hypothetical protein
MTNGRRNALFVLSTTSLAVFCAAPTRSTSAAFPPHGRPAVAAADATFEQTIRPMLARRCTPCHVPGGKMYDKLPFDDAEVVRSHRPGVVRRLKDPEEKRAFEAWVDGKDARPAG